MTESNDQHPPPRPFGEILPPAQPLSHVKRRLLSLPLPEDPDAVSVLYQHTVLCQTSMPYRNPGDVRLWERRNGIVHLEIQAGRALDPVRQEFVDVGLPFGPKPRLVLYHLNTEAIRTQSPVIELEDSLTAFVRRTLGLDPGGRNIRTVKGQLSRLAAADFRFGAVHEGKAITIKSTVIEGFEIWTPRDPGQRMLWPSTVQFSDKYFRSLIDHAVPLNEMAVARLAHSAMALDIYTWLAQRLHRVPLQRPALVPWVSLYEHFGQGYRHIRFFRREFLEQLRAVKAVYHEARFSVSDRGLHLSHSRPPVARRLVPVRSASRET